MQPGMFVLWLFAWALGGAAVGHAVARVAIKRRNGQWKGPWKDEPPG